jgi:hypothetical protein
LLVALEPAYGSEKGLPGVGFTQNWGCGPGGHEGARKFREGLMQGVERSETEPGALPAFGKQTVGADRSALILKAVSAEMLEIMRREGSKVEREPTWLDPEVSPPLMIGSRGWERRNAGRSAASSAAC